MRSYLFSERLSTCEGRAGSSQTHGYPAGSGRKHGFLGRRGAWPREGVRASGVRPGLRGWRGPVTSERGRTPGGARRGLTQAQSCCCCWWGAARENRWPDQKRPPDGLARGFRCCCATMSTVRVTTRMCEEGDRTLGDTTCVCPQDFSKRSWSPKKQGPSHPSHCAAPSPTAQALGPPKVGGTW